MAAKTNARKPEARPAEQSRPAPKGERIPRVPTGIPGFDSIIEGGLIPHSVNLLSGGTGTGKTLFAMQFVYNGAKQFNEPGLYLSFEETEEELKADFASLGLNFDEVGDRVRIVYIPVYDVADFEPILRKEIDLLEPKRIVVDSISALSMPMEDDFERRKKIFRIKELLKKSQCTSLLVSEVPSESSFGSENVSSCSLFGLEEFICDAVIVLHYAGIGGESDRAVRVIKMRRTRHKRGPVPMEIGSAGIRILKSQYR